MKRNSGFTLIELIVVMVILGILAATAAPKFINLQSDAKIAALKGLAGAINSAKSLIYAKALVQGYENSATATDKGKIINGKNLALVWGYPAANKNDGSSEAKAGGIMLALDVAVADKDNKDSSADWYIATPDDCTGCVRFVRNDDNDIDEIEKKTSSCYVEYTQATTQTDGKSMKDMPVVKTVTTGCK